MTGRQTDMQGFIYENLSFWRERVLVAGGYSRFSGTLKRIDTALIGYNPVNPLQYKLTTGAKQFPSYSFDFHVVVAEVDPETCEIFLRRYVVVHDCGTVLNPLVVDGFVYGGIGHGIGGAMYENFAYDENGQLMAASFMDYLIPTAHELPAEITVGHVETPSPFTEYGIKGGGEGGRMGAPPAVASAVEDALRPLGVTIDALPLTPKHVRTLIREAQARQPAAAE